MNSYKTVLKDGISEFIEKKSRFISYVYPMTEEDEIQKKLEELRKKHYDSTHVVFAYKITKNNIQRFSDDGEPQGTAGVPVLDVILKSELTDVLVVVVRYFGGTLLGAGGLVRAYSKSASLGIEEAKIITMCECVNFEIECPYNALGKVQYVLNEIGAIKSDILYEENITLKYYIKEDEFMRLKKEMTEKTNATVEIIEKEHEFKAI